MNLIHYVLTLFHVKFVCNSAFRNLVFRWEQCKGWVWRNWSSVQQGRNWRLDLRLTHEWRPAKRVTCVKHVGNWRVTTARSLQDKEYSLTFLLTGDWNSWLISVVSDLSAHLVLLKKLTFHIPSHTLLYIPLYPRNVESF